MWADTRYAVVGHVQLYVRAVEYAQVDQAGVDTIHVGRQAGNSRLLSVVEGECNYVSSLGLHRSTWLVAVRE